MSENTIKQTDNVSCGVCCAAMITGTTFEQTKREMKPHPSGGYDVIEIHKYCLKHGVTIGGCCYGIDGAIVDPMLGDGFKIHLPLNHPMLLGVKSERFADKQHWIYWDGKYIHDPNPNVDCSKRSLNDYVIIDFGPILNIKTQRGIE